MVDRNVIAAKLAELADRVARVRSFYLEDPEALAEDRDRLERVSFNLLLAVQPCLPDSSQLSFTSAVQS